MVSHVSGSFCVRCIFYSILCIFNYVYLIMCILICNFMTVVLGCCPIMGKEFEKH